MSSLLPLACPKWVVLVSAAGTGNSNNSVNDGGVELLAVSMLSLIDKFDGDLCVVTIPIIQNRLSSALLTVSSTSNQLANAVPNQALNERKKSVVLRELNCFTTLLMIQEDWSLLQALSGIMYGLVIKK